MFCFPPSYLLPLETADTVVISMRPNGLFIRTILNAFGEKKKKKKKNYGFLADNGHTRRTDVLPQEEELHAHVRAISTHRKAEEGSVMQPSRQLCHQSRRRQKKPNQYDILIDFEVSDLFRDYGNRSEKSGVRDKRVLPVLEPDRLYLELAFLMMFSWICDHSLSVLHLRYINDVFEK